MHRKRRLYISERRDDDAPDTLDGVERQDAAMAPDQLTHHAGFARRAERGADFLGLLHLNQAIDDIAARHQQAMDLFVDRVDLFAQLLQRRWSGGSLGCGSLGHILTRHSVPHPEERRSRRVSKDECSFSLMVRDGATAKFAQAANTCLCAPPHHEASASPG